MSEEIKLHPTVAIQKELPRKEELPDLKIAKKEEIPTDEITDSVELSEEGQEAFEQSTKKATK